jgi:high-affinity iron transporter
MMTYRAYVEQLLSTLQTHVATLVANVDAGDLAGAESAWLTAHLTWLKIGQDDGAYGAFGELGRAIDGTAAGLVRGTTDPHFTGFHKLELDLWTAHDLGTAATDAARLQARVSTLAKRNLAQDLPATVTGLADFTLRCHEVLDDALRDSLSGSDDYGSGTDLASVTADAAATRELLGLLAPVIDPRSPHLVGRALRQLVGLVGAIDATRLHGQWVAVTALPLAQRERVDAATTAVLETLAPVPDLLHILNAS